MTPRNFKGIYVCFFVSLVSIPVMLAFLSNKFLSELLPHYAVQYGMLVAYLGVYIHLVRPSGDFWNFETRGSIFYYLCCLLTTFSTMQLAVHGSKFAQTKPQLLLQGQRVYLITNEGISCEIAYCIFSNILCLIMIYRMDRYFSARNLAIYWSGATITNELIGLVFMVLHQNRKPEYSTFLHMLYTLVALWCLYHFLFCNKRLVRCKSCVTSYRPLTDAVIIMFLLFSFAFTTLRCLAALSVQQAFVKLYASVIEPLILHPSKFVQIWIAISGVIGLPCCLIAISFLNRLVCSRNIDLALLHAGSAMQGTLVYIAYAALSAYNDAKYRPSWQIGCVTLVLNFIFVFAAHVYSFRCVYGGPTARTTVCGFDDGNDEDDNDSSDSSSNT